MKISSFTEAKRKFTDLFDLRISDFIEPELSLGLGAIHINVFKFDDWLHKKFGDYESMGLSMRDIVIKEFSKEAFDFLNEIT